MQSHLTLSELQRQVRQALEERFPLPIWVSAEIADVKVNYSGHCYMELVEKGGDNGVPTAQTRAVIWRTAYPRIAGIFEAETGQRLTAGIRILAKVTISYHELYGFSLQINDIDPSYTLGDMERQRQQTIAQLQRDGIWEMNREMPLSPVMQRIAVISSAQAAGYRDFRKELEDSPYRIAHTLFDAFMQGEAAEESIIAALCAVADTQELFDAAVIIRGGGSTSDLNCFNAYRLCSYVAQFPLPVITGIGHDKDTSITDMVAHTALKTPTAVAGWLTDRLTQTDAWFGTTAMQLHDAATTVLRNSQRSLERQYVELAHLATDLATHRRLQLEHLAEQLPNAVRNMLRQQTQLLETAGELTASRSPHRILQLGFAVVRRNGKAVASVEHLLPGEHLDIEVTDGTFTAVIK